MIARNRLTYIGPSKSSAVQYHIYDTFRRLGMSAIEASAFYRHMDAANGVSTYDFEGLPFLLLGNDLVPYGELSYYAYNRFYLPLFKKYNAQPVPGLYWPVLAPEAHNGDFEAFLKGMKAHLKTLPDRNPEMAQFMPDGDLTAFINRMKDNYKPHFFGEKAKEIKWVNVFGENLKYQFLDQAQILLAEHISHIWKKKGASRTEVAQKVGEELTRWAVFTDLPNSFATVALNTKDEVVCAMICLEYEDEKIIEFDLIAPNHAAEYKPHSLASCANIKACEEVLRRGPEWRANMGLTGSDTFLYKSPYCNYEPILGLYVEEA